MLQKYLLKSRKDHFLRSLSFPGLKKKKKKDLFEGLVWNMKTEKSSISQHIKREGEEHAHFQLKINKSVYENFWRYWFYFCFDYVLVTFFSFMICSRFPPAPKQIKNFKRSVSKLLWQPCKGLCRQSLVQGLWMWSAAVEPQLKVTQPEFCTFFQPWECLLLFLSPCF